MEGRQSGNKEGAASRFAKYTPESFKGFLSEPYNINTLIACAFFSTGLYLFISLVVGGWLFQEGGYPVLVKQSTLFQLGESHPITDPPIRTFLVSRPDLTTAPFQEVHQFSPNDALFKTTPAQSLTEIIPSNSHDYCVFATNGYSQVSLTHTVVSPVNYSSRFIGISLGAVQGSILLLVDLALPSGYAAYFLLIVSLLQSIFLLYLKKREMHFMEDSKRRNLMWILELKRLGMVVPAMIIITICIGVKDQHTLAIMVIWSVTNQLMRVFFSVVVECVMTFTPNQRTDTVTNSISVFFLTQLFFTLYLTTEALKVVVVICRANNWFIAVPDMSVFESQYEEGPQVEAKVLSFTYMIGIWLLDVWSSGQYVKMIRTHLENKLGDEFRRGAFDYRLFSWNELAESLLNAFLFFVFFIFLASPRFVKCANN